jgi:riboflavin biosynthesis pyrimidine reductase
VYTKYDIYVYTKYDIYVFITRSQMHYNKACTSEIMIIVKTIFAEYPCLTVSLRYQNIPLNYNAVRPVICDGWYCTHM